MVKEFNFVDCLRFIDYADNYGIIGACLVLQDRITGFNHGRPS